MHGCIFDDLDFDLKTEHADKVNHDGPWLKKLTFDLKSKELEIE